MSDDHDTVAKAAQATRAALGDHVSAWRSQPYYLDITHPQANKGSVAQFLARRYDLAIDEIATIGDMYSANGSRAGSQRAAVHHSWAAPR